MSASALCCALSADELSCITREGGDSYKRTVVCGASHGVMVEAFDREHFYIIRADATVTFSCWNSAAGTMHDLKELTEVPVGLMVHNNRVYFTDSQSKLVSYDPLSQTFESFNLASQVKEIFPAGHGFVFLDDQRVLHGFHFNQGCCTIPLNAARLLGYRRGWVVVELLDGGVTEVDETGQERSQLSGGEVSVPFVQIADNLIATADGSSLLLNSVPVAVTPAFQDDIRSISAFPTTEVPDSCAVCLCEFEDSDGVTLDCGHCFHADCVRDCMSHAETFAEKGEHIVFTMAMCPGGCGHLIRHAVAPRSRVISERYQYIQKDSDAILQSMPSKTVDGLLYYLCSSCGKPFYGGEKSCPRMTPHEPSKLPSELLCLSCLHDFACPQHCREYVAYKCRYCCNVATNLCFGNRWACDRCVSVWVKEEPPVIACEGKPNCPLGGAHPQGRSYPIGCLLCLPESRLNWDLLAPAKKSGELTSQAE